MDVLWWYMFLGVCFALYIRGVVSSGNDYAILVSWLVCVAGQAANLIVKLIDLMLSPTGYGSLNGSD